MLRHLHDMWQLKQFATEKFCSKRILGENFIDRKSRRSEIVDLVFTLPSLSKTGSFFVQQIQVLPFCCFRVFINKQQREERSFYCTKNWFISVKIGVNINKFSSFGNRPPPFFCVGSIQFDFKHTVSPGINSAFYLIRMLFTTKLQQYSHISTKIGRDHKSAMVSLSKQEMHIPHQQSLSSIHFVLYQWSKFCCISVASKSIEIRLAIFMHHVLQSSFR